MNVVPAGTSSVANFASSASRSSSASARNSSDVRVRFASRRARAWNASTSASFGCFCAAVSMARAGISSSQTSLVRGDASRCASCRRRARSRRRTRRSAARRARLPSPRDRDGAVRDPVQRGRRLADLDDRPCPAGTRAPSSRRPARARPASTARTAAAPAGPCATGARSSHGAELSRSARARVGDRHPLGVRRLGSSGGVVGRRRRGEREVRAAGRVGLDDLIDQLGAAHRCRASARCRPHATASATWPPIRAPSPIVANASSASSASPSAVEQRGDLEPRAVVARDAGGAVGSRVARSSVVTTGWL